MDLTAASAALFEQEVITADLTIAVLAITAISLLFLGSLFLSGSGEQQSGFQADDTPTTLASRGVYTNVVIGRRRVGPIFGWAGFRFTKEEVVGTVDGGKGGGGGGGQVTQTVYFENGWHILSLGPARSLLEVYENGKQVLPNPINKANTPSGSTVQTDVGSFLIYWGEPDQPVCGPLASAIGVSSQWPYACYVFWIEKRLGTGPTWPSIEYLLDCNTCADNTDMIGSFEPVISEPTEFAYGANPAAIIYQLLTADFPHGAGLDPDLLDFTSLESFGLLMDSEIVPMNINMSEGNNLITKWLQSVMLDAGVMLVDHPDGRLILQSIREPVGTLPVVDGNYQTQPEVEVEVIPFDDVDQVDRVLFTYKDSNLNYRDNTVEFGDDGIAEENRRYRIAKVKIETITNKRIARKVANRRAPEAIGDITSIKYEVVRGATLLLPGQVFEDAEGRVVRVLSKRIKPTTPLATLECSLDVYGLPALTDIDDDTSGGQADAAQKDAAFTFFEMPAEVAGTQSIAIAVIRARANRRQAGAFVWASIDDQMSFFSIGNQNASAAGFSLNEAIADTDGPDAIESGPLAVATNLDAGEVLNLAGNLPEWQNGRQLCIIEDSSGNVEVFFIREISVQVEDIWTANTLYNIGDYVIPTAALATGLRYKCTAATGTQLSDSTEPDWADVLGGTNDDNEVTWVAERFEYQLKGMIRARYGTPAGSFSIGDKVYIVEASRINLLRSPSVLSPGETVCIKTQPFSGSEQFNIENVTAVCKQLTGDAVSIPGFAFVIGADGSQLIGALGDRVVGTEA